MGVRAVMLGGDSGNGFREGGNGFLLRIKALFY